VYATAAKTPLVFRQIVGRFVRTIPGRPTEPSWLYIPADPVLRDHAAAVEQELRSALRTSDDLEGSELERAERLETERGEAPAFVPLSADVAPQLTLFGSPAPAAGTVPAAAGQVERVAAGQVERVAAGRVEQVAAEVPAFERRARLRGERRGLVSELSRRDRSSHAEINAWLNRKLGITSVDQATNEDLERSVELLIGKLSGGR
jgi:hypothetical protein